MCALVSSHVPQVPAELVETLNMAISKTAHRLAAALESMGADEDDAFEFDASGVDDSGFQLVPSWQPVTDAAVQQALASLLPNGTVEYTFRGVRYRAAMKADGTIAQTNCSEWGSRERAVRKRKRLSRGEMLRAVMLAAEMRFETSYVRKGSIEHGIMMVGSVCTMGCMIVAGAPLGLTFSILAGVLVSVGASEAFATTRGNGMWIGGSLGFIAVAAPFAVAAGVAMWPAAAVIGGALGGGLLSGAAGGGFGRYNGGMKQYRAEREQAEHDRADKTRKFKAMVLRKYAFRGVPSDLLRALGKSGSGVINFSSVRKSFPAIRVAIKHTRERMQLLKRRTRPADAEWTAIDCGEAYPADLAWPPPGIDALSNNELAAILLWTHQSQLGTGRSLYEAVNEWLVSPSAHDTTWALYMQHFESALQKLEKYRGWVYRVLPAKSEVIQQATNGQHQSIGWKRFTATAVSPHRAQMAASGQDLSRCPRPAKLMFQMRIEHEHHGVILRQFSFFPEEQEILMARDLLWKTVSMHPEDANPGLGVDRTTALPIALTTVDISPIAETRWV